MANINEIRKNSIALAYAVPIIPLDYGIVSHPFTNMIFAVDSKKNQFGIESMLNLTKEEDKKRWLTNLKETILELDLNRIYYMVNKPYKLTWLKYNEKFLSDKEFSEYLADAWVCSENPNGDANVSISELIKWFKKCSKENLMEKEDRIVYESIPETICLYRGVGKGRNPYGLSYTASMENAIWFQNRYYKNEGFLITLVANKQDILAYFNTRNEDEYVVDTNKYKKEIKSQIKKD